MLEARKDFGAGSLIMALLCYYHGARKKFTGATTILVNCCTVVVTMEMK